MEQRVSTVSSFVLLTFSLLLLVMECDKLSFCSISCRFLFRDCLVLVDFLVFDVLLFVVLDVVLFLAVDLLFRFSFDEHDGQNHFFFDLESRLAAESVNLAQS